jgi:hypothetical protein
MGYRGSHNILPGRLESRLHIFTNCLLPIPLLRMLRQLEIALDALVEALERLLAAREVLADEADLFGTAFGLSGSNWTMRGNNFAGSRSDGRKISSSSFISRVAERP